MPHSTTVRSIQNRLFLLLLRAFIIAVAFLILFTLLTTGLVLANPSQSNPLYRLPTMAPPRNLLHRPRQLGWRQ